MKIAAYFIFPDKDDDFVTLGDNPETYKELISDIAVVKQQLKNHQDFELCYDAKNVKCFLEKAEILLDGVYLDNCRYQIQKILDTHSRNVDKNPRSNSTCIYVNWDIASCSVNQSDKIIAELSEATLDKKNKTILINIANAYSTDRDAIHVIKDAVHMNDLPIIISTPIINNVADFAEWYALVSNNGFSLRDRQKFERTTYRWIKQSIYRCLITGQYWYPDYFHRENKRHFEVFDGRGIHLGEADEKGILKNGTSDKKKSISKIIQ